jgi:hypothetical protein
VTAWTDRPQVVAAMLNPALIASVLASTAANYHREADQAFPWTLSFITAPLVLHRGTRQALPTSTRTHLVAWISRNPRIRAGFPPRAQGLVEFVREGIRFGLAQRVLTLEEGRLTGQTRRPRSFVIPDELDDILRNARFVGRWFAKIDNTATVFAVLGVAP